MHAAGMSVDKKLNTEASIKGYAIVTNSSYKLRDGRHVVPYKFDREGVAKDLHGISEQATLRKGKGGALFDCPFKGIGDKLSISLSNNDHINYTVNITLASVLTLRRDLKELIMANL